MASHPNSCDEVIDNSYIFTSPTLSCNSVKKKKKLNVSIVRVAIGGYTRWDDGVQTAMSSEGSFRRCRQNTCVGEHRWSKSHHKRLPRNSVKKKKKLNVSLFSIVNRGYARWDDGVQTAMSSEQSL